VAEEEGRPRVKVPATVARGEVFEVKTILAHPMETGRRKDAAGALVPRRIVARFRCTFEGREVCAVELNPGVAANPYLAFPLRLDRSGELRFEWEGEDGAVYALAQRVEVVG
jgi:thiosulfate oxidation carrier complex protein SoxZ